MPIIARRTLVVLTLATACAAVATVGGAQTDLATLQQRVDRLEAMHVYPRFIVDAEQGWAKDALPAPGPSRECAAPFPKVATVPFHYRNRVSGRVPPLLLP